MTAQSDGGKNVVVCATKKVGSRGVVGYFKTEAEVPEGFQYPGSIDITDVMESMRITDIDRCLAIMNSHWKR